MLILFQSDYMNPREVESGYARELSAAKTAGFQTALLHQEALDEGQLKRAVSAVPEGEAKTLYRGWMLRAGHYRKLYEALAVRGVELITSPKAYAHTHHFPECYSVIEGRTPESIWTDAETAVTDEWLAKVAETFGDSAVIIKDWVKSQKHKWDEACFIPSASDAGAARRVVEKFIELQDDGLTGGIVFRRFVELEALATLSKSGMPLTKEFRQFVLDGKPLLSVEYWEEGDYEGVETPGAEFSDVLAKVQSRFFTVDIARRKDGAWVIIELGDGQVAGLPERLDAGDFYRRLAEKVL